MAKELDKNYVVIPSIYDYLLSENNRMKKRLAEVEKNLKEAREIGDLSENASYENAKNEKDIIEKLLAINDEYLEECVQFEPQELAEKQMSNLYKVFTLVTTDIGSQPATTVTEEFLLTPNIELNLKVRNISITTPMGEKLLNCNALALEKGPLVLWNTVKETKIKTSVTSVRDLEESDFR